MNTENKYRKPFRIFGIVTLVNMVLALLFFFLFASLDENPDQITLSVYALLTLVFAMFFLIFAVVFAIFFFLKCSQDSRNRKLNASYRKRKEEEKAEDKEEGVCLNCGAKIHADDKYCPSCGKVIDIEPSHLLYSYDDNVDLKFSVYLKGYYASATTAFYIMLLSGFVFLALTLYCVIAKPEFEFASYVRNCSIVFTALFFSLFLICFLLTPYLVKRKKKPFTQTVKFYDDSIVVLTKGKGLNSVQNTSAIIQSEYSYIAAKKAWKDKEAYYLSFRTEKGAKLILMIGYKNRPQFTKEMQSFMDEKVRLINKR